MEHDVFRLIAILFTMWYRYVRRGGAEPSARPPQPPRNQRCHPGKVCRHVRFCNDAGRCCDTMDGDVEQLLRPGQACCGGTTCADVQQDNSNCGGQACL
jgi:hypothetical protein